MLRRTALILLLLSVSVASCDRDEREIPPETIAIVGERLLTIDDFKRYLERNPATELVQLSPAAASALLDQYVEEVLLSEYAASQDLLVSADRIAEAVRNDPGSTVVEKRDELQRGKLLEKISLATESPTDQEIRQYYEENIEQFEMEERIRIRQILLRDLALAEQVRSSIVNGDASFEEMAEKHSLAPNASKGGEVGEITRGDLPKVIEKEIFELSENSISPVIEAAGTYHIFKIERRLPAGMLDLESVAPVVSSRLRGDRIAERMAAETQTAKQSVPVRILSRRLPFNYTGTFPAAPDE